MNAAKVLEDLKRRFPNEPEYHQAVEEVLSTIEEEYNKHPEFDKANLIERLCIPDRVYQFRVTWVDDKGKRHEGNANAKGRWLDDYLKGGKKRNFAKDTFSKLYKKNAGL